MPLGRSNKNQALRTAKSDSSLHQQEYDRKTNQKVIYRCIVCALDRTLVNSIEVKEKNNLSDLFISHMKKRTSHQVRFICLQDRIIFRKKNFVAKSLFRDHVLYKDIEHFFMCKEYPDMFMLSVKSEFPYSSYCETYKCKDPNDTKRLCEIIYDASKQSDNMVHDMPSVDSPLKAQSMSYIDTQISSEVTNKNLLNRSLSNSLNDGWATPKLHNESPIQLSTDSPVRSPLLSYRSPVQTPMSRESQIKPLVVTPINTVNTSAYVSAPTEMTTNTTYFDYDPIHGPQINEVGPIYMFMVRHPSQPDMTHLIHES
ncbi:unnamed protein product [Schistosoma curassoni]|uniref:FERM domain-containing protein n=1 Tax=Schistosoma curassoni TaxID=6186 RepID=A0A183JCH9_9TREM|nr:unnamed protein product [Schistosoma curassoni]VDO61238.1 unnamed protein product [Schistosoma curassoni]